MILFFHSLPVSFSTLKGRYFVDDFNCFVEFAALYNANTGCNRTFGLKEVLNAKSYFEILSKAGYFSVAGRRKWAIAGQVGLRISGSVRYDKKHQS